MAPLSLRAVGLAALALLAVLPCASAEDEDVLEWITVEEPAKAASTSPLVQLTDASLPAFVKEHAAVLVEL